MVRRARKIVWTTFARQSRTAIFSYWNNRNKSTTYSKKLNFLFQESLKQLQLFPESSIESTNKNIRLQIASHFYLIYFVSDKQITVLDIWDTRQNPSNFPVK
jgi:plasmid stabilization system protein ParE